MDYSWVRRLALRGVHLLVVERVRILVAAFTTLLIVEHLAGFRPQGLLAGSIAQTVAGLLLIVLGLLLRSWAAGTLVKHHRLTTCGPYACLRHPLYLGSFLLLTGFVVLLGDWPCWLSLVPFVWLHALAITREERWLARRYGQDWEDYAARTPRWIPWFSTGLEAGWTWQQWTKNHEYHAWLGAAGGLALLECVSRW